MTLFGVLAVPVLLVLPGAWLAFADRHSPQPFGVRIALALVLSPVLAVAEFYALRAAGVSFERTVPAVVLLNLPALLPILRAWHARREPLQWGRVAAGSALFLAVTACVAIPYLWRPDFLRVSWHGLMHTDMVYAVARGGLIPEEPELAGIPLAYPWLGHVYWAMLAKAMDVSPTVVYLLTNLSLLLATGMLSYHLARLMGLSPPLALASAGLLALGPNIPGWIGWALVPSNASAVWWALLGDLRTAPFVQKFASYEIMTFGLALFAGLLWCTVRLLREATLTLALIACLLVIGTAALYPNLYPAAVVLLGAWPLALLLEPRLTGGRRDARWRGALVATLLAAAGGALFIKLFSLGRSGDAAMLSSLPALAKKTVAATLGLGPWVLPAWWAWKSEPAAGRLRFAVLGLAALGSLALNLGLRLPGLNEYKFFFTAGMCLVPLAMLGIERTVLRRERLRWMLVGALPFALAPLMLAYSINQLPPGIPRPYAIRTTSFWLALQPTAPGAGWTEAVRTGTPLTTVLVVYHPEFHTTAFTGRTLWVPTDPEQPQFGYNTVSRFNLVDVRGYSAQLMDERVRLLEQLYSSASDDSLASGWRELEKLRRPLAIHFAPRSGQSFLEWLRARQLGRDLYVGPDGTVVRYVAP